jgi:hypothetical protein
MMLLGETSELSFEPAIEGQSDRSSHNVPSGVAKKCVGTDLGADHCDEYRQLCSLWMREWSTVRGRTVRDLAQRLGFLPDESDCPRLVAKRPRHRGDEFADSTWISFPGRTPLGRRDPKVCLGIDKSPKTPLNSVELERGED